MIIKSEPLNLAQVKELTKNTDKDKPIVGYLKKFGKLDSKKAKELSDEVRALDNLKIKETHIVKIVDFLPKDAEDVNKIFVDVSLSEEEINKILEISGKY
jgi:DNA-directed RNA polymerase subunit F